MMGKVETFKGGKGMSRKGESFCDGKRGNVECGDGTYKKVESFLTGNVGVLKVERQCVARRRVSTPSVASHLGVVPLRPPNMPVVGGALPLCGDTLGDRHAVNGEATNHSNGFSTTASLSFDPSK
uniref:Uncharacterized protein n=1 Tax=Timema douglasi TaxID=61478 RepID=A0A7R8VD75_TIMDO|nr:unnamed protein product [Timema douglasi]